VKDNFEAAGLEMTIGDPARAGTVPDRDATAVARLKRTGAILLGKTNCPPYGGGTETDNPVSGRTNNPYDLARTPGGSSGGEAAIVAACGSACGLGTDSGASVRLPAHFCGLAAIKPTAGRVPVTGVIDDEGPIGALSDPRTQVGPLARAVGDVALLLRLVAGPDGSDGGVAPVVLGDPAGVDVGALHVGVQVDNGLATPTAETVAAVRDAADALRAAGAHVEEAAPPGGGHELTLDVWRSYGDEMSAHGLYRVLRRWDAFRAEMLAFADRYDLLVSPVFPSPARPHGAMNVAGEIEPTSFTTPASLTGWPAATVRAGTSPEGLPIGVQLVARPWRDDVALAAALEVERTLGGFRPPGAAAEAAAAGGARR
jgi:amidase